MAREIRASAFRGISGSERARRLRALLLSCTLIVAIPVIGWADPPLPAGGNVVSGSVNISTSGSQNMVITQGSDRAVVNWSSFSIGQGAAVDIRQPGSNSAILNRVTGDTTSTIYGRLTANGQVHIVNPNGIFIGPNGRIETGGGFVASTLNISDEDFRAGRLRYQGQGTSAGVTNQGVISVGPGGYAALIGGRVNNAGIISAPMGRIGLGAGERATLDLSGDGFLQVALPSGDDGDDSALVTNSGTLSAEGGRIEMRAATARNAARQAINLTGVAEARSVAVRNGVIVLGGGDGGSVRVSGRVSTRSAPTRVVLNSSERPPQPTGGQIDITGAQIALAGAVLDASGQGGGGRIRIGGDFGGEGTLPRARTLTADAATRISADALTSGDGGRIVLWSEDRTGFAGNMSARGGSNGGNGGFVEVSSRGDLRYGGLTDLRAPHGSWGQLLLDPENLSIPGTMSEATAEAQLALGGLVLDTSACPSCVEAGDITILADIDWTAATTFELRADRNIFISGDITGRNGRLFLDALGDIRATGGIDVDHFYLNAGDWRQVAATLPLLRARDFGFNWYQASFLRATGGAGTAANPYILTDVYGLQGMASTSNRGNHFALANDIDATGTANWTDAEGEITGFFPIGYSEEGYFFGSLDGNDHTIDGLFMDAAAAGMFNATDGAEIRDLNLTGLSITGAYRSAGVVGYAVDTVLDNVSAAGTVQTTGPAFGISRSTGGLIGYMSGGSITDSRFDGTLRDTAGMASVAGGYDAVIGGIVGQASGDVIITGATSTGILRALGEGNAAAGGIAGVTETVDTGEDVLIPSISNSTSSMNILGDLLDAAHFVAGGLVGDSGGTISSSSATGNVASVAADNGPVDSSATLGGLVGINNAAISDSFATGNVRINYDGEEGAALNTAGGLVGTNYSGISIRRAYATGNVAVASNGAARVGGFVGWNSGNIADAFSRGNVSYTQSGTMMTGLLEASVGGFAGLNDVGEGGASWLNRTAAHGAVTASTDSVALNVGGHTGRNEYSDIIASYANGRVTADSDFMQYVGGLIGSTAAGTVTHTYSTGAVAATGGGSTLVGGLIGLNEPLDGSGTPPSTEVNASFWDRGRSGQAPGLLPGYGTALSTAVFRNTAAFLAVAEAAGWDFANVWAPGDSNADPAIYTIDRVVFARPNAVAVRYGLTGSATTTGTVTGGPGHNVFAPEGDTLNTAPVFRSLTFPNRNVGTGQFTLATAGLTSGAGQLYRVVDLPAAYRITPAPLTITANDLTKTYGQGIRFNGTEFTTSQLYFDDAVDMVVLSSAGAMADADVAGGSYAINVGGASGSGLSNYIVTYVAGEVTVNRAALTITANDSRKTYGQGVSFDGTEFTTRGLLFDDTVGRVNLSSAGAAADADVGSGSYAINAAGASGDGLSNYIVTYVGGDMTVDRAALTITADDLTKDYGQGVSFDGTEFSTRGLLFDDTVDRVNLASLGAGSAASPDGSPYAITSGGATGSGLDNYVITYRPGALNVLNVRPSVGVDTIPRPPITVVPGLPNPIDTVTDPGNVLSGPGGGISGPGGILTGSDGTISDPGGTVSDPRGNIAPPLVVVAGPDGESTDGSNTGFDAGGTTVTDSLSLAVQTLEAVDQMSAILEIAAQACAQNDADVSRYLACLSDALDKFASDLDAISTDLPPGMENVAQIVRDARNRVDAARIRAEQRLAGASTDAERAIIRREAINEARGAVATASAEIRKAITLVRANDPELARVQAATGARIVKAVDSVNIELSRAVGL